MPSVAEPHIPVLTFTAIALRDNKYAQRRTNHSPQPINIQQHQKTMRTQALRRPSPGTIGKELLAPPRKRIRGRMGIIGLRIQSVVVPGSNHKFLVPAMLKTVTSKETRHTRRAGCGLLRRGHLRRDGPMLGARKRKMVQTYLGQLPIGRSSIRVPLILITLKY